MQPCPFEISPGPLKPDCLRCCRCPIFLFDVHLFLTPASLVFLCQPLDLRIGLCHVFPFLKLFLRHSAPLHRLDQHGSLSLSARLCQALVTTDEIKQLHELCFINLGFSIAVNEAECLHETVQIRLIEFIVAVQQQAPQPLDGQGARLNLSLTDAILRKYLLG